ncbi:uncharacterized protein LOC106151505 [Lingula anatina]|uniref:Uncharacterized protein LOC106151505 n=1 Tax=Lingula anatina TaxID=7574 RepID=A0A1S3H551_LINAN|nr:uncharacterized protein LOC106151505 [Lingula anatina]|eukprot:XP_013380264.1 uncharacterized protein LOC106151505 [Lingula anatina]
MSDDPEGVILNEKQSSHTHTDQQQMTKEEKGEGSMSRTAIAIAVLALLIAVVACVLVLLVWIRPELVSPPATAKDSEAIAKQSATEAAAQIKTMVDSIKEEMKNQAKSQQTHTFAYSNDWPPMDYLDSQGFLKGLSMDLVKEACKVAEKNCSHVLSNDISQCWDTSKKTGAGLVNRWYTACVGWYPTPERLNAFDFVGSLYAPEQAALYVRPGSRVTSVTGRNVGFREGWNTDAACLARNSIDVPEANRVTGSTFTELRNKLNNTEIDLIFAPVNTFSDLVVLDTKYVCTLGSAGLMMRKDIKNSMMWFHDAVEKMKTSGKFSEICGNALRDHGKAGICVAG